MKIALDGKEAECEKGKTILELCKEHGIEIPTLCFIEGLKPEARCRLCLVELDGNLVTSCSTYPHEGCKIVTDSERIRKARSINAELLMAEHIRDCPKKEIENELCKVLKDLNMKRIRFEPIKKYDEDLSESVIRNDNRCINCGKCIRVCSEIMGVNAIEFSERGHNEHVSPYFGHRLHDVACIKCGQCIAACPVGAIYEREHLFEVIEALKDKKKHIVVQTAPSVRVALGEEFGMPPGSLVTGKMVSALRKIGFDKVFDTDFGADMTIMEEASEFLHRLEKNGPFPMITTCCPAWIKFMEHFEHGLFPNMSSCKSPHEMLGVLAKTYYAEKSNIDKKNIVVVSVMPCTAKKFESTRPELNSDVDYVLTTRELAKLMRHFKIDFNKLKDEEFDSPLGMSTGAAVIFGATGGVMEAALRTAYELATGKTLGKIDFEQIRGIEGIKKGSVEINGKEIRFAAAHGGANIKELIKEKGKYHFIEMMACPGGCIGGGGQPWPTTREVIKKRMEAIYEADRKLPIRKSHENPAVRQIYKEFLGKPLSGKAEKLLHTTYTKRSGF
ncbi:[FeFe] hydrogenase, group A [Candidatus Woesearchaeota archaeon]|nr:[FeFe] hydrogenase, group A [Candidatus Woesearchaeota archaeon]